MKAKAIFFLLLCSLFVISDLDAMSYQKKRKKKRRRLGQDAAFTQGNKSLAVGGGFISPVDYSATDYAIYGTNEYKNGFPISIRAEYALASFAGIGAQIGIAKQKVNIVDVTYPENTFGFSHSFFQLCLRPSFHIPNAWERLDLYAAVPFGLNKVKAKPFGDHNQVQEPLDKGSMAWGVQVGANYYFLNRLGAFAEAGYARNMPMINFGVTVKL